MPALGAALARRGHEVVHFSAAWDHGRETRDGVEIVKLRRLFGTTTATRPISAGGCSRALPCPASTPSTPWDATTRLASIRAARLHRGRRTLLTDLGMPLREYWDGVSAREARVFEKVAASIDVYSAHVAPCRVVPRARTTGAPTPRSCQEGSTGAVPRRRQSRDGAADDPVLGGPRRPHKESPLLLDALPLVAREEPDVRAVAQRARRRRAAAGRRRRPRPAERTRALGLGEADRQHERYGRAWVTCLPSLYDSFGMALVESLACGTPMVTTTQAAPQELVDPGVTGELCAPEDPESLAAALLRALRLARDPATVDACRASAERFDWDEGLAPLCERLYRASAAPPCRPGLPVSSGTR